MTCRLATHFGNSGAAGTHEYQQVVRVSYGTEGGTRLGANNASI